MLLTLFADASHCPKTKAGGWGAWAKRADWNNGRLFSGPIVNQVPNSGVAEMHAIMHAIEEMDAQNAFGGINAVMIQSDSARSLAYLLKHVPGARLHQHADSANIGNASYASKSEAKAFRRIADVIAKHELHLIVRHVRGHKPGEGRQWVNEQCDRLARTQMKARRIELEGEKYAKQSMGPDLALPENI